MRLFSIVVAFDSNYGIGKNGTLAWSLPSDLKHFKEITSAITRPGKQNAVIMGRKTWESLPSRFRPLPGRVNMVLSKGGLPLPQGVLQSSSLDEALEKLSSPNIDNIFVIGGAQIYKEAINHPSCQRLYITHVRGDFNCDAFFPPISQRFMLIASSETAEENGISFNFCEYLL